MSGEPYKYAIKDCTVLDKPLLERYRAKRTEWLAALRHDEHHPISNTVMEMVWADVRFRILAKIGEGDDHGALNNQLLTEALVEGHFATQALAIRRLMDDTRSVVSLTRVLQDIGANLDTITRENFVSHDGLPYDYQEVEQRFVASLPKEQGAFWMATLGPEAWDTAKRAHEMFDRLSGVSADARSRTDRIPRARIEELRRWMKDSDAESVVEYADNFLAHARDVRRRGPVDLEAIQPNLNKITNACRCFVRVTEALLAFILYDSGHGSIMATPQFDQFEYLENPVLKPNNAEPIRQTWDELAEERDGYIDGVLEDLLNNHKR